MKEKIIVPDETNVSGTTAPLPRKHQERAGAAWTQTPEEYKRFEELSRQLIKVPKDEVDKKRKGTKG